MIHLGSYAPGETVYIPFSTNDASGGAVGFSATIEAADFDIYKDGSATQRTSTAGFTVTETFDSVTGLHMIAIDLSDDTDAGFYATGSQYAIAFTPDETVDGETVAVWLATWRIEATISAAEGTVQSAATAGDTDIDLPGSLNLTDGSVLHVHTGTGAGSTIIVKDYSTPASTTIWGTLPEDLGTDSEFIALPGLTGDALLDMLTDDLTRIDASALNTASGAVGSDGSGLTEAGGTGDHLSAVPWNAAWDAEVQSEATDALNAYGPPTRTEATSDKDEVLTRLGTPDGADIAADIATVDTVVDANKVILDALGETAAGRLALSMAGIITGTAQTGTLSTTQASTDLTGFDDDQLIGGTIYWTSGDADGERSAITDYASTNGVITFDDLTTAPANGDTFFIA